jgi:uncharacterized protein
MSHVKKEMLSFFLTSKCNLDCIYCYTNKKIGKHKEQTLPFEFAKLGIDYYINQYPHIRFFGAGEPTEEFELLKNIYEYSYDKVGSILCAEIQSNGAFNEKVRTWMEEHMNIIWISLDGTPDIQNKNRPFYRSKKPSSPVIEQNIKHLIRNGKGMTGARVTITDNNSHRQKELIDYLGNLGLKNIWTDPLFPTVGESPLNVNNRTKSIKPLIDMDLYVDGFIEAVEYAKIKDIFYGSFLACNFDEENKYHCRACIPVPHLTTDGFISACDMALFGKDMNHMDKFIYGKWDKDKNILVFDDNKINYLQSRSVSNMDKCHKCSIKMNCGGYCLGEVTNETGDMYGNKVYTCRAINKLAKMISRNFGCYEFLHP